MTAIDRRAWLALALATAGGGARAAATRATATCLQLERELQDALSRRDRAAVQALLAEDFGLRWAAQVDPMSADEWLRREFAQRESESLVRDLSVREFDGFAAVSFVLDRGGVGRSPASTFFVVDIWHAATRKLVARSITRAAGVARRQARPDGRE